MEERLKVDMRKIHGLALGGALLIAGCTCFAQDTQIQFGQIEMNTELAPRPAVPDGGTNGASFSGLAPAASTAAPSVSGAASVADAIRILRASQHPALGTRYFLLNGLHLGMAGLDLALTQRCIDAHRCREGNPLMPASLAGRAGVEFGLVGFGALVSGRMKLHGLHSWWVTPFIGIVAHGVGVATGLAHQ